MKYTLLAALAFSLITPLASAQDDDGPTIKGGVEQDVEVDAGGLVNAATGLDTTAVQSLDSIDSGTIKGNVQQNVQLGEGAVVNAATGDNACAEQDLASIGKKKSC